jgi:catechol 2,3-dioxygenase-like lactoylglutathione lyase family enzyme
MTNLVQVTPMLHVPDLALALDFFAGILGFKVMYRVQDYAYLQCEGVGIRILEASGRQVVAPDQSRTTVYIDVQDVDGLHAGLEAGLEVMPIGDVVGPVDQDWGQRELLIRMPDGDWLAFGQPVRSEAS